MRVFLDTNVLASAAATRGLCADVLREVLTSHELLTSAQVLNELERVFRSKFGIPQDLIADFISLLSQDIVLAKPGAVPTVEIKDESDLPILSAAISAKADVFVTGDKEILGTRQAEKMATLSPRELWGETYGPTKAYSRTRKAAPLTLKTVSGLVSMNDTCDVSDV